MTTAQQVARQILARARILAERRRAAEDEADAAARGVGELKQLAERTATAYDEAVAASGLTREHFRLRMMLRGMLEPPPSK